ncbi:nucleotidyltransferase domain-containing protein [archaeon]|jgi:predicted nucleotidyltransferase|nr:nucleotidyltransferase domain-containing protein [archaeon]
MIAEKFLKLLTSESKKLKNKEIFDIVIYGSSVKGKRKINDIDIIFIFNNFPLEKRLEITQKFKSKINLKNLDIKSINLKELFDKTFLARQGIILEGISLLDGKPFSKKLGFEGFTLFTYNTSKLSNTEKVKLTFALNGRREEKGLITKLDSKKLGNGKILVPIRNSNLFLEFLETRNIEFKLEQLLIAKYK